MEPIFTNPRSVPAVIDQRLVVPIAWRVAHTKCGESHALVVMPSGSLRVTSPIFEVHATRRELVTSSGRRYQLDAPPVIDGLVCDMLGALAERFGLDLVVDVSSEVWKEFLAAVQ